MNKTLLMLSLFSISASAAEVTLNKPVDGGQLREELVTAGCVVNEAMVVGQTLTLDATGCDYQAVLDSHIRITDEQRTATIKTRYNRIKVLLAKLKLGTISAAEKDELLMRLVIHLLGDAS